jgi:hypothetical protein
MEVGRNYYREIYDIKGQIEHLHEKMSEFESGDELKSLREKKQALFKEMKKLNQAVIALNAKMIPVDVTPLPESWNTLRNRHDKIVLMFGYYDEPKKERREELLEAIHNNINNTHIDEVVVYLEVGDDMAKSATLHSHIKIGDKTHVKFVPIGQRLTYKTAIDYGRKYDDNTILLVCNNDCYFDETVDLLRKVNYKNGKRLMCMTRMDQLPDGTVERGKSPPVWSDEYEFDTVTEIDRESLNFLDYVSADSWVFLPSLPEFASDFQLGTWSCENFFAESAHLNNVELRNPCEYVRCIHIHNTNFRREYTFSNEKTSTTQNRLYPADPSERTPENWINGSWRIRSKYNYVDKDTEIHEYSDYVVTDFMDICEET